jgi:beta-N-acetylhexosaminidase
VAAMGLQYMRGLQDHGIISVAKHFPGHGDTGEDSHYTLPVITHSNDRLDSVELVPFRHLIQNGVDGIMTAHLFVPSYDSSPNLAATLSPSVVTTLLHDSLGFNGLTITDALDMKGVTAYFAPGDIEIRAFLAGNDILLLPQDVPKAVRRFKQAVEDGIIGQSDIDARCRKILAFKYLAGLSHDKPADTGHVIRDLDRGDARLITRQIFEKAVTLVRNNGDLIPLNSNDTLRMATLSLGVNGTTPFQDMADNFAATAHFYHPYDDLGSFTDSLLAALKPYNLIIVGLHGLSYRPQTHYGMTPELLSLLSRLQAQKTVILDIFGSPYALTELDSLQHAAAVLVSYQDCPDAQEVSAQIIFGSLPALGHLPVTGSVSFPLNSGIVTRKTGKLAYVIPEEAGVSRANLYGIDSLINRCIADSVFPGCQVMAAKDGKVFYQRSFGYHRYDRSRPVKNTDLYDLASITKVAATTLAVMKLYDEGRIDLDKTLSDYLPFVRGTDKGPIRLRDMMTHQARLKAWIPFYQEVVHDGMPDTSVFSRAVSVRFPYRVAEDLYIRRDYPDILYDTIVASPLLKQKKYLYSDLGFYFLKRIVEDITNKPLENYVEQNFYRPLGLTTICFRPLEHVSRDNIVPTEVDTIFRHQLLWGDVHDPGAAMLGGVSGHAGLFSDANDLMVIMQMLLQHGRYAGKQYIDSVTVAEFTRRQFPGSDNRRGLGFDKPDTALKDKGPACILASPESFGHTGFTGTYLWADPANGLIFVFLSNRVHPSALNNKLIDRDIRTTLQKMFYEALKKARKPGAL